MQTKKTPDRIPEYILILNRYFTPFAVALVGMGILLGQPPDPFNKYSFYLILIAIIFNAETALLATYKKEWSAWVSKGRLVTNFSFNLVFFYMLGNVWEPIWLLFVLTPIAVGLYGTQGQTIISAHISAGVLLLGYAFKEQCSLAVWGQGITYAAFIVFVSLFIHDLKKRMTEPKKPA
ncbi:hypothetical protein ACFL6Y_03925 [Elusimicrobiota bacterium]